MKVDWMEYNLVSKRAYCLAQQILRVIEMAAKRAM